MQLDAILGGGGTLLYLERYVDEGARTYSPFAAKSEVAPKYQPRSACPSFDLITVLAPQSSVSIFQAEPEKTLYDYYVSSNDVRFVIHPETWEDSDIDHIAELHELRRGEPIDAAPTASTRTVLTMQTMGD